MSFIDANASGSYGLIGQDITKNGYLDLVSFAYSGTSAGTEPGDTVSLFQAKKSGEFHKGNLERIVLEKRSAGGHTIQLIDIGNGCRTFCKYNCDGKLV